ncbi:YwqG family protein, partial [Corynebacterium durum]|uniref:YwqG family protein n=1 Tax=Corynebacterium durum TaxID=61592 RepID=UPI0028806D59
MGKILDQVRTVMSLLNERDQSQMVRITATVSPEPIPVTVSKFGGVPYLPEGVDAPTNADGDPLGMIAQINCAELPDNDVYPKTGIVQFWLNLKDDQWGMNFDNPIAQDNTRVTYYPEVGAPDTKAALPQIDWEDVGWPIYPENVELALSFEVIQQGDVILSEDFFDAFVEQWNSLYPDQTIEELDELDDLSDELVTDFLDDFTEFHKIGGKPIFVQNDPREFEDNLKNYTVDLLTIVSEDVRDPR